MCASEQRSLHTKRASLAGPCMVFFNNKGPVKLERSKEELDRCEVMNGNGGQLIVKALPGHFNVVFTRLQMKSHCREENKYMT